jgi:DNA (cytosine-5)-methyltransferase 1
MALSVGSLFTGIGGIDLAAEWAGMEITWQCEKEEFCQKVLRKHWPGVDLHDDITTLDGTKLRADVIAGGFPCQPYSIAGKRGGEEDYRALWGEMFRIIEEVRPRWVVGENVANFVNMGLDNALFDLESIGYKGQPFVIPANAVGGKHRRDRVFIVAYSDSIGRMEYTGQQEKVQQSGEQKSQQKESGKSVVPESLYSIKNGSDTNGQHVEGNDQKKIQGQSELQGIPHYGSIEEWAERSAVYQPKLCRSFNGAAGQVDRIRALGNAVVPQQIYPIFKAIAEIESMPKEA